MVIDEIDMGFIFVLITFCFDYVKEGGEVKIIFFLGIFLKKVLFGEVEGFVFGK